MGIGGTGINILDRVGGGDAFASGLIYAMLHDYKAMYMINFAVASSAIKHTIHSDANITDDVSSIRNLMNMNYDIKRCVSPQRFRLPGTDRCTLVSGFFIPSASQIDTNLSFFTKYVIKSLDSTSQNMLSFVNILEKI